MHASFILFCSTMMKNENALKAIRKKEIEDTVWKYGIYAASYIYSVPKSEVISMFSKWKIPSGVKVPDRMMDEKVLKTIRENQILITVQNHGIDVASSIHNLPKSEVKIKVYRQIDHYQNVINKDQSMIYHYQVLIENMRKLVEEVDDVRPSSGSYTQDQVVQMMRQQQEQLNISHPMHASFILFRSTMMKDENALKAIREKEIENTVWKRGIDAASYIYSVPKSEVISMFSGVKFPDNRMMDEKVLKNIRENQIQITVQNHGIDVASYIHNLPKSEVKIKVYRQIDHYQNLINHYRSSIYHDQVWIENMRKLVEELK